VEPAGYRRDALETPAVHAAAERALEAVRAHNGILDLNTAGWRKGLGEPYPAPRLAQRAQAMGVPLCFGDDSHRVSDVGQGVAAARDYLLGLGIPTVTVLTREGDRAHGPVTRRVVKLEGN
jgi:histidinol-phosphatase (PHP family)